MRRWISQLRPVMRRSGMASGCRVTFESSVPVQIMAIDGTWRRACTLRAVSERGATLVPFPPTGPMPKQANSLRARALQPLNRTGSKKVEIRRGLLEVIALVRPLSLLVCEIAHSIVSFVRCPFDGDTVPVPDVKHAGPVLPACNGTVLEPVDAPTCP
jgi:hypothetical protein